MGGVGDWAGIGRGGWRGARGAERLQHAADDAVGGLVVACLGGVGDVQAVVEVHGALHVVLGDLRGDCAVEDERLCLVLDSVGGAGGDVRVQEEGVLEGCL